MTTSLVRFIRHGFVGSVAAFLLFALLILPCKYAVLYLTREGLRLATTLGIMDETSGLGGQVLGYNYYRNPVWMHWVIGFFTAAFALGISFACCLLVAHRIRSGTERPAYCGVCGTNIDKRGGCIMTAQGLQCPECKTIFVDINRTNSKASESPLMPRFMLMRLLATIVSIGAAHVYLDRVMTRHFHDAFLRLGEATGSPVFRISGFLGSGTNGPFYGQDLAATFWNTMYRYGPTFANAILACLIAIATHKLVSGLFGRTRLFGYRGPTRCGGCNYNLANLGATRCPECGKVLAGGSARSADL